MSNSWDRFEGIVQAEEVVKAQASFAPVEAGDYNVKLEKFDVGENEFDNMNPQIKCSFRMESNRILFADQALQLTAYPDMTAMLIGIGNDMTNRVRGEKVPFTTLGELASRVETAEVGGSYKVNVSYKVKNGVPSKYPTIKIVEKMEDVPF